MRVSVIQIVVGVLSKFAIETGTSETGPNTKESPGDLRRLAVTLTPVKN